MERRTKKNSIVVIKRKRKRVLAIVLAILMVVSAMDFGGMQYVSAADENKVNIITAFTALSGEIANQQLAVGASVSEINLPDSLSVASEVYYVDEAQAVTGAAISVNSTYNLTGVTWELHAGQSSLAAFDSSVGNTYYTYVPVLPTTDTEGNPVRRAEGVRLPQIRVQISSYGTQLYTITTNHTIEGNPVTLTIYSTQNDDVGDLAVVTGTGTLNHDSVYTYMFFPYGNIAGIKKVIIGEGITGIGTLFNSYLRDVTEVELPSTLTAIEEFAFRNCTHLTSITIPEGVTSIGNRAFGGCTSLVDLVVSNNSKLKTIEDYAFINCSNLADKDIFTNCQQLESVPGEYAFYNTNYSGEIILPRNLTSFAAFVSCKGKITTLYIPDTVLTNPSEPANVILKYKIENNQATITYINNIDKNTTSVTLPETICGAEVVAVDAQYRNNPVTINCTNHKIVDHTCQICGVTTKCGENTYYEYTGGVLSILGSGAVADYMFADNSPWYSYRDSIRKIIIGKDITRIGTLAFADCTALIDIELEEESALSEIGDRAFFGCTSLEDVDLFTKTPLTKIENQAFVKTSYTGVLMLPDTLTTLMASSLYFNGAGNVMVIVPEAAYVENPGTDCMWYLVENGEVTITQFSFVYMSNATITVPETINGHKLVAISDEARTAISKADITLTDTAHSWDAQGHTCRICGYTTKCGDNMFYSIQDNVLTLSGSGTMYNYSSSDSTGTLPPWDSIKNNITKVVVGEEVTSIGKYTFYECDNLENLVFEEGSKLQEIGGGAFLRCTKLSDVMLPETLERMDVAFQSCSSAIIYYPENTLVSVNSFAGAKDFITYKVKEAKKYITSPTTDMLKVPEELSYTGVDLKEMALLQFGIIKDAITVQGVNFDVDIDETKWVKSIVEGSVINRGTYTAQYTGTFTFNGGDKPKVISKTFTVGKGVGVGSVMIANWEYGSAASTPVPISITNGTDNVNFYYKDKDATDATYKTYNATQEGMYPVNAGDYTLKVVFESTDSADEVITFADFTIYKATIDNSKFTIDPYTATYDSEGASYKAVSVTGNDGYLNDKAVTYSTSKDGTTSWSEYTSTVPTMTDAGTLYVKVKISADNYDDWISGVLTASISAKSLNDSMINNISNQYYTGNAITPSVTVTDVNSLTLNKHYTVESCTNNTEVGTATVTIKGKDNYTGSVNKNFIILYYDGTVIPAYNGNTTKTAWYDGEVTITAEDFTISDSLNGSYTSSYIITGEGSNISKKFYYKKDGTGYITDGKSVVVNIDKTVPTFSGDSDGITISDNNWKGFLNQITFGHFFKENKDVSILATDSGSDVDKYYYYIDTGSTTAKTAEDLNSISFTEGSNFSITDGNKYIIYAYALDQAGNKSAYICTDGIVIDKTAPTVTLTAPAGSDLGDVSATAKVQMNETGIITYVIKTTEQSGMTAQNIFDAADKKTVSVIDGQADTNFNVEFSDLTANNTYYMYAVGTDSAENNGSVISRSFITTTTKPIFADNPTITGTYGRQVKDMVVSQVASTNGVAGSWSVSSTDKPSVGTAATYDVVFTPDNAAQDATVTVEVTPTVNPKSLTAAGVIIEEVTGTYTYNKTEKVPTVTVTDSEATITASDYEYSYSNNVSAGTATVTVTAKGNYTGSVSRTFTIAKATAPSITWPNASSITYGQKLSASALSVSSTEYGTFAWTDGSTVPTVTNGGYEVTFTPNAGTVANYEAVDTTDMVAVTVAKATSAVTVSADISDDGGSRKATLTATVTGVSDGEVPTGTVRFVNTIGGSDVDIEGATAVTITGGKATYTWTGLAKQIYKVKAVYKGSANYNTASSTEITFDTNVPASTGGSSGGGSSNGGGSSTATPQSDTGTPEIKDASNKVGWEAIKEQINKTREGDTVTIEMNGSLVVLGEVLDVIRGTDTTLVFDMGEGITWRINGQSITDSSLKDVNLDVTLDTDAIPAGIISQMAGEQDSNTLSLAYDGPFGFTSVLTINLDKINAGKYGNLFYYNPVTKQLTLQAVEKIGEKGTVELPFSHASDYVVIISEEPMLEKTLDQIAISAVKRTLYVGGTKKKSMTLKLELPQGLKEAKEKDSSIVKITYKSSNPKVATVNASGKITAKKAGKTTITTQVTINGVQRKFKTTITVKKAYIKLIKSTNTLKTGSTFTYKAIGYGVKTEDILFYTSKKSIVVINKKTGKAKARTQGTDYIIAKDGKVKVKIKVKVS